MNVRASVIDDRSSGTLQSSHAGRWQLLTGDAADGRPCPGVTLDRYLGKNCLRMRGRASAASRDSFVQLALDLAGGQPYDASGFDGLELEVAGNGELYNLHLRTTHLWLPWQSYRAGFVAAPHWQALRIPFAAFKAHHTASELQCDKLIRVALVASGRNFEADLCLAGLNCYRDDGTDER